MKPFISNKNDSKAKITLIEDERIISKDDKVAALQIIFNYDIENCYFPDKLKSADVSSPQKAETKTLKRNYRPVSVLPTVS